MTTNINLKSSRRPPPNSLNAQRPKNKHGLVITLTSWWNSELSARVSLCSDTSHGLHFLRNRKTIGNPSADPQASTRVLGDQSSIQLDLCFPFRKTSDYLSSIGVGNRENNFPNCWCHCNGMESDRNRSFNFRSNESRWFLANGTVSNLVIVVHIVNMNPVIARVKWIEPSQLEWGSRTFDGHASYFLILTLGILEIEVWYQISMSWERDYPFSLFLSSCEFVKFMYIVQIIMPGSNCPDLICSCTWHLQFANQGLRLTKLHPNFHMENKFRTFEPRSKIYLEMSCRREARWPSLWIVAVRVGDYGLIMDVIISHNRRA